ncbi:MAG: DoxX family membrane protein [Actinomycetota bacterium]|nr:DoxX family membrane protein [Actinomycetota bacterium]
MKIPWRELPARAAIGAHFLHSGLGKWDATEERAQGLHAMATGAYPFLGQLSAEQFTKALSAAEIGIGAALLLPFVRNRLAGAALSGFAAGLVGMYLRTPTLHKPGSFWPTPAGIAIAKDVWLLGTGVTLMCEK